MKKASDTKHPTHASTEESTHGHHIAAELILARMRFSLLVASRAYGTHSNTEKTGETQTYLYRVSVADGQWIPRRGNTPKLIVGQRQLVLHIVVMFTTLLLGRGFKGRHLRTKKFTKASLNIVLSIETGVVGAIP